MNDDVSKWLESARLLRKKTQKDVAQDIGISQGKLSKAETGMQNLPEDVMRKLADYYDVPLSYFEQEWDVTPVSHMLFRRKITIPQKNVDSIIAEIRRRKTAIDQMMKPVDIPEYDLGIYLLDGNGTIENAVEQVRYKLKCINGPIKELAKRLENHGVIIQTFDFGTEKMDGLTTVTNHGRKVIFLNSQMPNDRMRFSLAHELGHLVMHIEDIPSEDRDVEDEANRFASQLLMPAHEIKPQLQYLNFNKLIELKQRWGVSMRALVKRAYDLGTINQETFRNFQINFSKKGYNKKEPLELPAESATIIETVIKLYHQELGYNDDEIMSMLNLNEADYNKWFDGLRKTPILRIVR